MNFNHRAVSVSPLGGWITFYFLQACVRLTGLGPSAQRAGFNLARTVLREWNKGGIWVRHSGEHARPSVKVSGVSRAKRSFLDSNQGLRVPIRDVHCAWVYREYDRGKSPPRDGPPSKSRGSDFALFLCFSRPPFSLSFHETVTCHVWLCARFPYFQTTNTRDTCDQHTGVCIFYTNI